MKQSPPFLIVLGLLTTGSLATAQSKEEAAAREAFFERKVRPVLAEHCWSCHGPQKQKGGIRLDSHSEVLKEGEAGPIVVPGKASQSAMWKALQHVGDLKMPPKGKLPAEVVADIGRWIDAGAVWPGKEAKVAVAPTDKALKTHWAFQPVRMDFPTGTSIDSLVKARLQKAGLSMSPRADLRTLIRRLSFDLIGLPPSPEEIERFESDLAPDAYEKLVDRLLASPRHGERWARHWLDVARYADTKGYVFFEESPYPWGYTYRDYVIRSLNEDKPYDRFVLEQLAADRLDLGNDRRPLTAMGFLTIGGRFMNNVHDVIDDRIDVVTRGLMGLTVTCARCHDHKYDPVSMKDYYGLYGIFASSAEPTVPPLFEPPPKTPEFAKFDKELREKEAKLMKFVRDKHAELVSGARTRAAEYLLAAHAMKDQPSTEEFMLLADTKDINPTMTVRWAKYLQAQSRKPGRVFTPWFTLSASAPDKLPESTAQALKAWDAKAVNPRIVDALKLAPPKNLAELAAVYSKVLNAVDKKWQDAGRNPKGLPDASDEELRAVFYGSDAPANVAMLPYGDLSLLPDRPSQATLQKLRGDLEKFRASAPGAPARAMVLEDLPTPYDARVFLRGNPNNKGEPAPRHVPAAWHSFAKQESIVDRLALAKSIIDPRNPLTARVFVNRAWMHHFGQALVSTPGDFGIRGDPPANPELLDFLASTFMGDGWSMKKFHRRIVLSETYRQQSADRAEASARDPENRLVWRQNRRRLDFESLRDSLLAGASRLDDKIGGPSVDNAFAVGATRRTMYARLDRLNVPGIFRTFDFPSPDATAPKRDQTTIATQALFLMNHPLVLDCADKASARTDVKNLKSDREKIDRLFRVLLGRPASPDELLSAQRFLEQTPAGVDGRSRLAHALMQTNEFAHVD